MLAMYSDRQLDAMPVRDGFRQRGTEMTRIETFTDAAFAFALTLLVISIDKVPSSYGEMKVALLRAPGFAVSAALMMCFWYGHHIWSRRYGLDDGPTIVLSTAMVCTMLVYVYPLKAIASGMLAWISGGDLPAHVRLESSHELYGMFALYAAGFIAMSTLIAMLYVHALRRRAALSLNVLEVFDTYTSLILWAVMAAVGLVSLVLALFTDPISWVPPGTTWFTLPIIMPMVRLYRGRRRRQLGAIKET